MQQVTPLCSQAKSQPAIVVAQVKLLMFVSVIISKITQVR